MYLAKPKLSSTSTICEVSELWTHWGIVNSIISSRLVSMLAGSDPLYIDRVGSLANLDARKRILEISDDFAHSDGEKNAR